MQDEHTEVPALVLLDPLSVKSMTDSHAGTLSVRGTCHGYARSEQGGIPCSVLFQ